MAFPKEGTRVIHLTCGQAFVCHLSPRWFEKTHWIAVREAGKDGQLLLLNPWHFDIVPSVGTIRRGIRAGFRHGWQPEAHLAPLHLEYDGTDFVPVAPPHANRSEKQGDVILA